MDIYSSEPATINTAISTVYSKLANPLAFQKLKQSVAVPDEAKSQVKDLTFGQDTISFNVNPVGNVTLRVTEREEPSRIVYTAEAFPIPLQAVIKLESAGESVTVAVAELHIEVNMFVRAMVDKPLREWSARFGEILANLPYDLM